MQFLSQISQDMQLFLIAILSLIFGSFASFVSYRLGNSKNLLAQRSSCVNCGYKLKIQNLIPLFSYIFQKGKCSNCQVKISLRYPAIELSFLISFLFIYFVLAREVSLTMLLYFAITSILITISIIDLENYFIPNSLQYILAVLAIVLVISLGGNNAAIINIKSALIYTAFGLALWAFFYFAAGLEAIGVDDIKFLFIAGLMLGEKNFLIFTILTGFSGLIFGSIWQKIKKDETFPFAPALCISLFIVMLFGKKLDVVDIVGSLLLF
jgi:prepilin signal peptidase PulO-like enzyme (type II secretory pathway)